MPLLAGSLNFAWEVNALFLSNVFYGHVLWAVLDIFIIIHNVRFLEKSKRIKYLLFIAVLTFAMYGIFRIPNIDGQKISSFLLDLIMAVEYGLIVLLLKLFYLAICLEQNSHNRKKVQR